MGNDINQTTGGQPAAPDHLPAFAAAVLAAIAKIGPEGRFGARKVFISAILDRVGVAGFRRDLLLCLRHGLLLLCRADLVAAMDPVLVSASEINDLGATFHFVIDPSAREPWELRQSIPVIADRGDA